MMGNQCDDAAIFRLIDEKHIMNEDTLLEASGFTYRLG